MFDLGFAMFLALISAGLGCRLLRWTGAAPEHPSDRFGLAVPLGMGLVALAVLGLGQCGGLNMPGLLALLGGVAALGLVDGLRLARDLIRSTRHDFHGGSATRAERLAWFLLVVALGATVVSSLAPVTDGDALCYHLQVPKVFLARGATFFDPDLHETVYPLATEMLYLVALAFRGPVSCRLIQWTLGLAFAANAAALARPSLGPRAWWAGAVALLVPAVTNGMTAPLNDVALAAFGTAAIVAWTRFHDRPDRRAALLAGAFAGLAVGVKYPALVLAGMLLCGVALRPLRWDGTRRAVVGCRDSARFAFWFATAALVVGGAWHLRAFLYTGNPVFPFFRSIFGAGLDEVLDPIKRPLPVTAWNILTALGPLTLEPHRFDSFAHQFGPVFLLFLPALLLERAPRRVLGLTLLGYGFLMLCMTQRQSMRFLLIAIGPLSVGVAYLAVVWGNRRSIPSRLLTVSLIAALGLEVGVSLTRAGRVAGTVFGPESESAFLDRREPSFRVGRWVDANLPPSARLIGQDHRGFYIPRPYAMELAHRRRTGLGTNGETADEIVGVLKQRGFTHLLLCPPKGESDVEFDPTMGELLAPWLASRSPLYQADLNDSDELVRSYSIYDLESPAVRVARSEGPAR